MYPPLFTDWWIGKLFRSYPRWSGDKIITRCRIKCEKLELLCLLLLHKKIFSFVRYLMLTRLQSLWPHCSESCAVRKFISNISGEHRHMDTQWIQYFHCRHWSSNTSLLRFPFYQKKNEHDFWTCVDGFGFQVVNFLITKPMLRVLFPNPSLNSVQLRDWALTYNNYNSLSFRCCVVALYLYFRWRDILLTVNHSKKSRTPFIWKIKKNQKSTRIMYGSTRR